MTREDFHSLALDFEDALFAADLKPTELRMARMVVKYSLRSERTTTPPILQKDFGLLAGVRETHVEETLGWLLGKKVIELEAPGIYRPNIHFQTWVVRERMTAAAKAREAELLQDRSAPEFWRQEEVRAGDPRVAFPDAAIAAAAEMRAEPAERKLPKSGSLTSETRKLLCEGTSEIRKSSRDARVRAHARHGHELSFGKHEHDHVHAPYGGGGEGEELTPAQSDLLEQINELTALESPEQFERTWRMRLRGGGRNEVAAFKAIGQTRLMQRQGEIRKSAGATLNYYFRLFRDGVGANRTKELR